ncbi:MAG: metal ABC transporter solute-binding protein, Zn/Mn family [Micromonosporaceae bacterium]
MRAERSTELAKGAQHQPGATPDSGGRTRRNRHPARTSALLTAVALALVFAQAIAGCSSPPRTANNVPKVIRVVAAERLWGSIAAQLGGTHASIVSIISSPRVDPRSYRATAADRRAFGTAQLLILNGAGYDPWAGELANSTPGNRRAELNAGDNVGVAPGGNPYLWYDPDYVQRVAALILADYAKIDPPDAGYFEHRLKVFEDGLVPCEKLVSQIKGAYSRTPVGSSTPIAAPLAAALGLTLVTPPPFLQAMMARARPSATDTAMANGQIMDRKIKLYIYDSRDSSPTVAAQLGEARAHRIPVVGVSAALSPASATFQQWQAGEVMAVARALSAANGR